MPLSSGTRLGPYEIQAAIGAGGMGEVYKARDTRLDRTVAIKVLPPQFSADPERRARFEREAKTIAGLSHPHICTLHDVGEYEGSTFLVMEHLTGETLAQRLQKGPLPLEQALGVATEIADGLSAAHRQGVIHRDLKPGNVMLTKAGAKLLDFGLAKLKGHGEQPAAAHLASAPTQSTPLTGEGMIVGTLQYMAPEQLERKPADARTDLWALGAILYEMVTGKRAFEGTSPATLIGAILEREPTPLSTLQPLTPPGVDRLVRRCLAKVPEDRPDTAHDLAAELRWVRETSDTAAGMGLRRLPRPRWRRWLVIGLAGTAVLAALFVWLRPQPPPSDLSAVALTTYSGIEMQPSFSPDGSKVAFVWNGEKEDNDDIYIKQIGSAAGTPLRLTESPLADRNPAWSPDDRWIAFTRHQQGNVAVILIPPLGGQERKLTEATSVSGLCWTPDGKWLVVGAQDSTEGVQSIRAISIETEEHRRLTSFLTKSASRGSPRGDYFPSISPDGQALAFARQVSSYVQELYVLRLTPDLRPDGEPRLVTNRRYGTLPGLAWTANGREIVYAAGGGQIESLWRVSASGGQVPQRLPYVLPAARYPAIARRPPRLAYTWYVLNVNLWRLDTRTGERRLLIGSTYDSRLPQYSPDGRKIAFQSNRSGSIEVWTCDADGSDCLQLTSFGGPQCGSPRWSPDSRWLALDSRSEGQPEIYVMAADGGQLRRMTNHPAADAVPSWSSDGRWIYFTSDRSGSSELWKVPKDGGEAVQVTRAGGHRSFASPDGRWIYYCKLGQQGLFRMPPEGGDEKRVFGGSIEAWDSFGVTRKGVYFMTGGTIQLLDEATGKVSTVATLDKPRVSASAGGGGITVSSDDAYIVWVQADRNTQDLMLVENFR